MVWPRRRNIARSRQNAERNNRPHKSRRSIAAFESIRWRSSLHTVFVTNLPSMITSSELWQVFNNFGVVVDVFLPSVHSSRSSRFAFVRYRFPEEYRRAVSAGSDLIVAGRKLRVCQATERKRDTRQHGSTFHGLRHSIIKEKQGAITRHSVLHEARVIEEEGRLKASVARSIKGNCQSLGPKVKERLHTNGLDRGKRFGENRKKEDPNGSLPMRNVSQRKSAKSERASEDTPGAQLLEDKILDLHIPEADMDYLFRSAIGFLTEATEIQQIRQELSEGGLVVQARRINKWRILLTFDSEDEMKQRVKSQDAALQRSFIKVIPWIMAEEGSSVSIWIKLEDVPLELWHKNFFRALGNNWGTFLELDESTEQQLSFEFARLKLLVKNRDNIPDHVVGESLGVQFNITISMEEFIHFEPDLGWENRQQSAVENTPMELHETTETPSSGEVQFQDAPLGAEQTYGDDSLTLIMGTTANRRNQGMRKQGLPTEIFLQMCMANEAHGEVEFPLEWQIVTAVSNTHGPSAIQQVSGLREDCVGFSFMVNSMDLDEQEIVEYRTENREREINESAEMYNTHCSLNQHRPQNIEVDLRSPSWSTTIPTSSKEQPKEEIHHFARGKAKDPGTHPSCAREGRSKRKGRSVAQPKRSSQMERQRQISDSTNVSKAATKIKRNIKVGAAKKKKCSKSQKTSKSRGEDQSDEVEDIARETISDGDIQHRNRLLKEANETLEVAGRLGIKLSKDNEEVVRRLIHLETQDQV